MRFLPCYTMTLLRLRIIVGDARIRTRNLWCITMSHNISQVYVQYIMSSFRKINCKKLRNFCCFYLCQVSGVGTAAQTFQTTYNIYCSLEEINIFYKFAKFSTLAPPTSHMETLGRGFSYRFLQATPEVWVCYNTHILTLKKYSMLLVHKTQRFAQ